MSGKIKDVKVSKMAAKLPFLHFDMYAAAAATATAAAAGLASQPGQTRLARPARQACVNYFDIIFSKTRVGFFIHIALCDLIFACVIGNARSCKYNKSTSVRKDKALLLGKAFCYLLSKEPYLFTMSYAMKTDRQAGRQIDQQTKRS